MKADLRSHGFTVGDLVIVWKTSILKHIVYVPAERAAPGIWRVTGFSDFNLDRVHLKPQDLAAYEYVNKHDSDDGLPTIQTARINQLELAVCSAFNDAKARRHAQRHP